VKGRDYSEDIGLYGKIILECTSILRKQGGKMLTRFMWLSIVTGGGLL
jgi:hypothetical protein